MGRSLASALLRQIYQPSHACQGAWRLSSDAAPSNASRNRRDAHHFLKRVAFSPLKRIKAPLKRVKATAADNFKRITGDWCHASPVRQILKGCDAFHSFMRVSQSCHPLAAMSQANQPRRTSTTPRPPPNHHGLDMSVCLSAFLRMIRMNHEPRIVRIREARCASKHASPYACHPPDAGEWKTPPVGCSWLKAKESAAIFDNHQKSRSGDSCGRPHTNPKCGRPLSAGHEKMSKNPIVRSRTAGRGRPAVRSVRAKARFMATTAGRTPAGGTSLGRKP